MLQQVGEGLELEVHLDLVVLEGNQRQSETSVAAEPELQGHVQDLGSQRGGSGLEVGGVTDHLSIASSVASGEGQLVPDVQPGRVVLVNALATDLELNVVDQSLTDVVDPVGSARSGGNSGEGSLEVHAVDQITIAGDGASDLAAEVDRAVEGLLDRLHGEVGVTAVNDLEEGDLRVTSEVNVLGAIVRPPMDFPWGRTIS